MNHDKTTILQCNTIIVAIILSALRAGALWIELPAHRAKCLSEEIQPNVVLIANYTLNSIDHRFNPTMSVKVTSPFGNTLHSAEKVTEGQFAFTTAEAGNYLVCFWVDSGEQKGIGGNVNLDWKIGINAKDWDSVAKKEKLQGVELELRKLEEQVDMIHEKYILLRSKEMEMRDESERTNSRVAWLSILSIAVCIGVAGMQIWYLTNYFQKKKLI
ncbi:hypothetical protein LUZ60_002771 [Juncus effusus]|nr:hypothetical protein LUZ60_002771 [Juncus effusus]